MRHIPNILSAIRLLMVGAFVWLFAEKRYLASLAVFGAAYATDVLDGWLARRFGWVTDFGKLLDPVADKLMTVAALACICFGRQRPIYLVILVLIAVKELLMLIGGLLMVRRHVIAVAAWPGKVATGLFAAGVILALLSFQYPAVEPWSIGVLIAATALSWFALFYYAGGQLTAALAKRK